MPIAMPRYLVASLVFLAGLLVVAWIGLGPPGRHGLGAGMTALIAAGYLAGAWELYRYDRASAGLDAAVEMLDRAPARLQDWLAQVPAGLRESVRLRVQGERVPLPAPLLTPYLVGLLVLLGMLGTLLGMMVTLRGTGLALESAGDLAAVQSSLAAPVKGLGFAFGTSIAGVASSAMLGLLAALARRARVQAVRRLDQRIAGVLQPFSRQWQREQVFGLLQRQAEQLPALVERLQAMTAALQTQAEHSAARQLEAQQAFHARTEAAQTAWIAQLGQTLQASVGDSARAVGATLQPLLQETLHTLARQATELHAQVQTAVRAQLDGVSAGLETATTRVAGQWETALQRQQQAQEAQATRLQQLLDGFAETFGQRSDALVDRLSGRMEAAADIQAEHWRQALAQQTQAQESLARHHAQALEQAVAAFTGHGEALLAVLDQRHAEQMRTRAEAEQAHLSALRAGFTATAGQLLLDWRAAGEQIVERQRALGEALAAQASEQAQAVDRQQQALTALVQDVERRGQVWLDALGQAQSSLRQVLEARDTQRLATWTEAFAGLTARLEAQWNRTGQAMAERQQAICEALARTADAIGEQGRRHAEATFAEVARLLQTAAEAPKAAADMVAELRQKLSDSMVRDTAMLDERNRLLGTLETLLDAVNRASGEQRVAAEALVSTSADLLEQVGRRFSERIESEAGKLEAAAAQITGSAMDVAGLGEAFGAAVQAYGASNEALMQRLEQIATALEQAQARGDEQLAYYVAQAREVVDLSVLSQRQIVEELQRLATRGTASA